MKKIVTLGEIMLRLSPPRFQKIEQTHLFEAVYGGSEANVAISLSKLGLKSSFVSKLPKNPLGVSAEQYLKKYGVLTNHMIYGGERLGIYFLEKGFSIRTSKVIYDRKGSSFSIAKLEEFEFDEIFKDADWFHVSGITPALNEELFRITKKALQVAKEKGITTSCDLNYRSALWSLDEARKKMTELIEYVDICIGIEPLQLLGEDGTDIKDRLPKPASVQDYKEIMGLIQEQFHIKYLAMTFRESISVNRNRLKALLFDGDTFYQSSEVEVEIVDRVGTGDAFAAGLIYALINNYDLQNAIEFATVCFALKHTIEGDVNLLELGDIEAFAKDKTSLSIRR
ncbi:sugar kinase [Parageobacillus thermoglucosidasius]|uniref:sugar kinase n=1 Tax=Parageobacillus thermoglucosidasius TaxID=1426 RepID=UPI000E1A115D|nr:sugar kinase [Parageobacillus thermoglucosidasius]RDE26984.1 sugar kinase [Parageobacillus thermoglucosidasius]